MPPTKILILSSTFLPTVGGLQYELKWFLDNLDRRHTPVSPINSDEEYYLVDVVAFILLYLKDQLYGFLDMTDLDMSQVEFDWVVTVPAIWDARGKQMMREAAYKVVVLGYDIL